MDKEKAKEFIFLAPDESRIYTSKDVYELIELSRINCANDNYA